MASASLPFGIDISRYQGIIDWNVVAAHVNPTVEFVIMRAAISWGYKDTYIDRNWSEARRLGLSRGAYHVFYPTEDPVRQMAWFIECLNGDLGEMPLSLDVELSHDATPAQFQTNLLRALEYVQEVTQRKPIIYSRASFINAYVTGTGKPAPAWYKNYDWWLAQYLLSGEEHPGPPTLPYGVPRERVIIHQTSATGDGDDFGMQSAGLDYNRWQFEQAHLDHYAGLSISQPESSMNASSAAGADAAKSTLIERLSEWGSSLRKLFGGGD